MWQHVVWGRRSKAHRALFFRIASLEALGYYHKGSDPLLTPSILPLLLLGAGRKYEIISTSRPLQLGPSAKVLSQRPPGLGYSSELMLSSPEPCVPTYHPLSVWPSPRYFTSLDPSLSSISWYTAGQGISLSACPFFPCTVFSLTFIPHCQSILGFH
jgi:hypothetical protein